MGFADKFKDYRPDIKLEELGSSALTDATTSGTLLNVTSGKGFLDFLLFSGTATSPNPNNTTPSHWGVALQINIDGKGNEFLPAYAVSVSAADDGVRKTGSIVVPINLPYESSCVVTWATANTSWTSKGGVLYLYGRDFS